MRRWIAVAMLVALGAGTTLAQDSSTARPKYPLYRSPMEKQADYIRSQTPQRRVVPIGQRSRNVIIYRDPYRYDRYPYGRFPYGRYPIGYGYPVYRPYYGPAYPLAPPVIRTWPVTPYPFRIP